MPSGTNISYKRSKPRLKGSKDKSEKTKTKGWPVERHEGVITVKGPKKKKEHGR